MKKKDGLKIGGKWTIEVYNNKDEMKLISMEECHNIVVAEGIEHLLNDLLNGGTQIDPWYCLVFDDDVAPAATATYAAPDFTESTAYDEATRPEYNEAAASSGTVTNSANKAVFTMAAAATLYGAALVGGGTAASTKGNTAGGGVLFAAGAFGSAQPVIDDNVVNLTYAVTAADDAV